jgi:hypothetical protein
MMAVLKRLLILSLHLWDHSYRRRLGHLRLNTRHA